MLAVLPSSLVVRSSLCPLLLPNFVDFSRKLELDSNSVLYLLILASWFLFICADWLRHRVNAACLCVQADLSVAFILCGILHGRNTAQAWIHVVPAAHGPLHHQSDCSCCLLAL